MSDTSIDGESEFEDDEDEQKEEKQPLDKSGPVKGTNLTRAQLAGILLVVIAVIITIILLIIFLFPPFSSSSSISSSSSSAASSSTASSSVASSAAASSCDPTIYISTFSYAQPQGSLSSFDPPCGTLFTFIKPL